MATGFGLRFTAVVCSGFAGLMLMAGCAKPSASADPKVSVEAVKTAEVQWAKAAAAHDIANVVSFYADDAVVMPANQQMLTNKLDVQKTWSELLDPKNNVTWKPMWVEAAKSGEMVYDVGSYEITTKPAKGKNATPIVSDRGKYLAVWKKQADGTWKAEAGTWNSDLPKGKG